MSELNMQKPFGIRGFNMCESILRHSPEQLTRFIRRMKTLHLNTLIVHYDYGWKRYRDLILRECADAGVEITLMTFGPRTFFSYTDAKPEWFAKDENGRPFTEEPECETQPCRFQPEGCEAFYHGAVQWLRSLPPEIRRIHMRAGDGLMFCRCEKCRELPDHEKWQPFVELFTKAVLENRPDLEFETDIYVKRYNLPENRQAHTSMHRIMYDTFFRHPHFPIGSELDTVNKGYLAYAATEKNPDAPTPNSYHWKRIQEWAQLCPGRVYIHDNAMAQGLFGTFQQNTGAYLQEQELYRRLGIRGICYEAYEPGYSFFEKHFEVLFRAMEDPASAWKYRPTELEKALDREFDMAIFCTKPDFPIEKYIQDPVRRRQAEFYREYHCNFTPEVYRNYLDFAFEHSDIMDPLVIGFCMMENGLHSRKLKFESLSEEAGRFIRYRKLWDFMEKIPLTEDPIAKTRKLLEELRARVR
ncbi:MAG: hypothetical protein BWY31_01766 [Lentisphaerae bacterium ADurb.Bin242]|nr:MAG: hypothetical protein BWY31_01766 [Lentisphaerae bacterium ADurb.Bin242]